MRKTPAMLLAIGLILLGIPALGVGGALLLNHFAARGLDINPNFAGGTLVARFDDAAGELDRLPDGAPPGSWESLDVTSFAIRTHEFPGWAGLGIEPRINLVFDFRGTLANTAQSAVGFSLPAIQVAIDAHGGQAGQSPGQAGIERAVEPSSAHLAAARFESLEPDFIVIIDGYHSQARIYGGAGRYLAAGVDLYIDDPAIAKGPNQKPVVSGSRIVASLPARVIGDIDKGTWRFGWAVGLADPGQPSGMAAGAGLADSADGTQVAATNEGSIVLCPVASGVASGAGGAAGPQR